MWKEISLPAGKKVLGDFLLNSKNGVKTPRWRSLGIKKCHIIFDKEITSDFL